MPRIPTKAHCTHGWPWFTCPCCEYFIAQSRAIMQNPAEYQRILEREATKRALEEHRRRFFAGLVS